MLAGSKMLGCSSRSQDGLLTGIRMLEGSFEMIEERLGGPVIY